MYALYEWLCSNGTKMTVMQSWFVHAIESTLCTHAHHEHNEHGTHTELIQKQNTHRAHAITVHAAFRSAKPTAATEAGVYARPMRNPTSAKSNLGEITLVCVVVVLDLGGRERAYIHLNASYLSHKASIALTRSDEEILGGSATDGGLRGLPLPHQLPVYIHGDAVPASCAVPLPDDVAPLVRSDSTRGRGHVKVLVAAHATLPKHRRLETLRLTQLESNSLVTRPVPILRHLALIGRRVACPVQPHAE
mmetsp:Transcript_17460/g.39163  ORF Transcript_17460/g.39163 Transcript_17460/m.39163 type:complete len:249 (+) Transcript_17460:243-989(+)